jgi:hypothetical protein
MEKILNQFSLRHSPTAYAAQEKFTINLLFM